MIKNKPNGDYLGQVKPGKELGYKHGMKIWHACVLCGKPRWVATIRGQPHNLKCVTCANADRTKYRIGEESHAWRGGITYKEGYKAIRIEPDSPFYSMSHAGKILEHRLVMAKYLGRCLESWEFVHHKNGIRYDNRLENLQLTVLGKHTLEHSKGYQEGYIKGYKDGHEAQIRELKAEIRLLRLQLQPSLLSEEKGG